MEIRVSETGIDAALKKLDPQRAYEIILRWYGEATQYAKRELKSAAPPIVRSRVKVKQDPMKPPRWALVGSTHPLAHIFEGGTGPEGAPNFNHAARHFPRVDGRWGLMEATGLPKPQAFAMASAINEQGGLRAKPFIKPTFLAIRGQLIAMADRIVREVFR